MYFNKSVACRRKLQLGPETNPQTNPPWIEIRNIHAPVHPIDVNVTIPVVGERKDQGVPAAAQSDTAIVTIDIMIDTITRAAQKDHHTIVEIVIRELILIDRAYIIICSSITSLVTTAQEGQKQRAKNSHLVINIVRNNKTF